MKIGDIVIWEDWAGPQKVIDIYCFGERGAKIHTIVPDRPMFADLEPLPGSKQVGHGIWLEDCDLLEDIS